MAVADTEYYDLLNVKPDADDSQLKKGYRLQAIKWHPDKNPSPDAEEKFKDISIAYQTLSDPNSRAWYDKYGKKSGESAQEAPEDPSEFFAKAFGGEAFRDYIGEISLMKEMTSRADVMMTDEERAEMEAAGLQSPSGARTPSGVSGANASPTSPTTGATPGTTSPRRSHDAAAPGRPTSPFAAAGSPTTATSAGLGAGAGATPAYTGGLHVSSPNSEKPSPSPSSSALNAGAGGPASPTQLSAAELKAEREKEKARRAEQKAKLRELDEERRKETEARIAMLTIKLKERITPFVNAKHPGDENDRETIAFREKMHKEAEDLKIESFGVEILHTIGNVYIMKATSFMKSRKFLGIPGFFSRMKERGALVKDVWGLAMGVHGIMDDMKQLQNGELPQEELRALEADLTGKILLASWRGTRFEITQILREVVDNVLHEKGLTDDVLVKRAKAIMLIGVVFKSAQPDESEEERRELERLVAEAAKPKKKAKKEKAPAAASSGTPPGTTPTVEVPPPKA